MNTLIWTQNQIDRLTQITDSHDLNDAQKCAELQQELRTCNSALTKMWGQISKAEASHNLTLEEKRISSYKAVVVSNETISLALNIPIDELKQKWNLIKEKYKKASTPPNVVNDLDRRRLLKAFAQENGTFDVENFTNLLKKLPRLTPSYVKEHLTFLSSEERPLVLSEELTKQKDQEQATNLRLAKEKWTEAQIAALKEYMQIAKQKRPVRRKFAQTINKSDAACKQKMARLRAKGWTPSLPEKTQKPVTEELTNHEQDQTANLSLAKHKWTEAQIAALKEYMQRAKYRRPTRKQFARTIEKSDVSCKKKMAWLKAKGWTPNQPEKPQKPASEETKNREQNELDDVQMVNGTFLNSPSQPPFTPSLNSLQPRVTGLAVQSRKDEILRTRDWEPAQIATLEKYLEMPPSKRPKVQELADSVGKNSEVCKELIRDLNERIWRQEEDERLITLLEPTRPLSDARKKALETASFEFNLSIRQCEKRFGILCEKKGLSPIDIELAEQIAAGFDDAKIAKSLRIPLNEVSAGWEKVKEYELNVGLKHNVWSYSYKKILWDFLKDRAEITLDCFEALRKAIPLITPDRILARINVMNKECFKKIDPAIVKIYKKTGTSKSEEVQS